MAFQLVSAAHAAALVPAAPARVDQSLEKENASRVTTMVALTEDLFKYNHVSLTAFNCPEALGEHAYRIIYLAPKQMEAFVDLHKTHFKKDAASELFNADANKKIDIVKLISECSALKELHAELVQILNVKDFPEGAVFRGVDSSAKDVMLINDEEREKMEIEIWERFSKEVGYPLEDLFGHSQGLADLWGRLKELGQNFNGAIEFLNANSATRIEIIEFYSDLFTSISDILTFKSTMSLFTSKYEKKYNIMALQSMLSRCTDMLAFINFVLSQEKTHGRKHVDTLNTYLNQFLIMIRKLYDLEIN